MSRERRSSTAAGPGCPAGADHRRGERVRHRLRPAVQALEDRRLLSTFDVTSTADDGSIGTLRWAVNRRMRPPARARSISIWATRRRRSRCREAQLELSNTAEPTTITGPGAGLLSIDGNEAESRVPDRSEVTASLSGLTISGGSTTGFGGGLYNDGTATLTDCTSAATLRDTAAAC